jgi:DNA polymerase-3 subunit gamma/tau
MTYQVLARRLRPTSFDELVGQEHVVRALVNALDALRLHHAYLFTGTRGVGKTTIARLFAKCLNCETGITSKPCGQCTACREIAEGRFVDLIEVDAASRTKVDDTRELLDNVQYRPTRGRFKVYLIDEVHMLSAHSFNALLKTLEEPPEHVKFLLATTDPKKLPVTVLSRCLQFQLRNLLPERIRKYLAQVLEADKVPYDDAALAEIARAAQGSMRDALSITDQAIAYGAGRVSADEVASMLGTVQRDELAPLVDALLDGSGAALMDACAALATRGADFASVLAQLLEAFHAAAVTQAVGAASDTPSAVVTRLASDATPETTQLFYQIALMGLRDLALAPDPRTGFEMTMLRMLAFEPVDTLGGDDAERPGRNVKGTQAASKSPARNRTTPSGAIGEAIVVTSADAADWDSVVRELQLSGVAKMIAEHSVLESRTDSHWTFCLDRSHDTLLSEAQQRVVARALSNHLHREVSVVITPGTPSRETPAVRRQREQREQHAAAVAALRDDANVRSLVEAFDGRLDVDSVQPVALRRTS